MGQPGGAITSQADMTSVTTSGVDPFLGQGGNSMESHARQNSADSGLGKDRIKNLIIQRGINKDSHKEL